jgi:trk/ktr system potassium uptake protein
VNILIAGAGNVGRHLAQMLERAGHDVTLVEQREEALERARAVTTALGVHGDACEPHVLESAGVRAMDVVVATTGDDEDNIVVANLAKFEFGVAQVVARVNDATHAWLYDADLGVDVRVSTPHTIAQLIEERVSAADVVQLVELARGEAAIVEGLIPADSPVQGRRIADVDWPADCVPTALVRGAQVLPARGDMELHAGDRLLVVADAAQIDALHRVLGVVPPSD